MATVAERTELKSQRLKSEASSEAWVALLEVRRHGQEQGIALHRRSPSLALRSNAEPICWPVQAPASRAPPTVKRLTSRCARNERRNSKVSTLSALKGRQRIGRSNTICSGRKALSALRSRPNLKHKLQYGSVQGKSVSASGQEPHSTARPNPSIEGMPKRLRLLCTPHVKR